MREDGLDKVEVIKDKVECRARYGTLTRFETATNGPLQTHLTEMCKTWTFTISGAP
jgi:hypothetical protein